MNELDSMLTIMNIDDGINSECSVYDSDFGDDGSIAEMYDSFGGYEVIKRRRYND